MQRHVIIRKGSKQNETKACKSLKQHGKYFIPPPKDGSNFKELFKRLATAGAGRPVDQDGFSSGPWTPDLLTEAISQIDANQSGIDLRTVQLWFQDNEKGIGADNIHWLARIFGCGDPAATSEWQVELSAAQSRLTAKRRENRKRAGFDAPEALGSEQPAPSDNDVAIQSETSPHGDAKGDRKRFSLAETTEAMFHSRSSFNLPVVVFAAAAALGLISFTLNIHSVVFTPSSGPPKQVGFLWAPNWTITFLAVLPFYLALLIDLLKSWKQEWRSKLIRNRDPTEPAENWESKIAAASYSYWTVLILTLVIASGYNWTATHLIPLLQGDPGNWPVDWGRIAIVRPDVISIPSAILFTGIVFLYNAACSYLFFTGIVFLLTMTHDYLDITQAHRSGWREENHQEIEAISIILMNGVFRCTALGLVITILMKLQSSFLLSDSTNILNWLMLDMRSAFNTHSAAGSRYDDGQSAPGLYYSFFCMLAIFAVYLNASVRIRSTLGQLKQAKPRAPILIPSAIMDGSMVLLVATYLAIGELPGFTILLIISSITTTYLIFKPAPVREHSTKKEA